MIKNKSYLFREYLYIIISFVFLTILSSFILLMAGKLHGNDIVFNIKRIVELKLDIIHYHSFFPFSLNTDHGAAVLMSYPSLNLFPIALISIFGISVKDSILLIFVINIFITLIISFFSSLNFSKSIQVSYIFSILYATSYVFIVNNFLSMDLGVANTYIYLPLVIFGFLKLLCNQTNNYLELSVGLSLILLSHLPSFMIILSFLLFWLLINIKNINIHIICAFVKAIFIVICVTSIFWLPFLEFIFNNKIDTPTSSLIAPLDIKTFILNISIWAIFSIFLLIFIFNLLNKYCKQMYFMSILIIIISSSLMPYKWITSFKIFKFINKFQFTYRFLQIPQILLLFLFAILISKLLNKYVRNKNRIKYYFSFFIIIALILFSNIACQLLVVHEYSQVTAVNRHVTTPLVHGHGLKIDNNHAIKYLINIPNLNNDYLPASSNSVFKIINHNKATHIDKSGKEALINVKHKGFNKYIIYNHNKYNGLIHLPIVEYNNEHMSLFINGRKIPHYVDKTHRVTIPIYNAKKLYVKVNAQPTQSSIRLLIIQYILVLIGICMIFYKWMANKVYINHLNNGGNKRNGGLNEYN